MSQLRVLHCPELVAGCAHELAKAERMVGLESWCVCFRRHGAGYAADEILSQPGDGRALVEFRRWKLFLRAFRDYDVIHFNFGQTIMPQWDPLAASKVSKWDLVIRRIYSGAVELLDLVMLRRLGKAIFVTFQGDDARQGDFCRAAFPIHFVHEVDAGYYSRASDDHKRYRIRQFELYANGIFALNPDLLHVLPAGSKFVPYPQVDLSDWKYEARVRSGPPVVVHAPSHQKVKGSRFILDAVSALKSEGIDFRFILVENLSRAEAREIYERADLIIDQLLGGWYGGLAVEAMALGVPVVAYIRDGDLKFIPTTMKNQIPVINATPATIKSVLRSLLTTSRSELSALGVRCREYVEKWHRPSKIAEFMKSHYESAINNPR